MLQIIVKLTSSIYVYSNIFFIIFLIKYLNMYKNSLGKYYQDKKERVQKKPVKNIKFFLKKKKKKSDNVVVNDTKYTKRWKTNYRMRKNDFL